MGQNLQQIFHFLQHDLLLNLYFDVMEEDHHQYLQCNENLDKIWNGSKRYPLISYLDSFWLNKGLAKQPGPEYRLPPNLALSSVNHMLRLPKHD